ncbi:MAG: CDP-glucose 4,6-dehydratase [Nitrospiraceae bacterium]|nr:CDP-glucose 4,6-dehydratase [Nitrospiraceae bacterium]
MINRDFWRGRKVFITGHTGFKGSWLCLWLRELGADITGYALDPPTAPSLFELCNINRHVRSIIDDVRDGDALACAMTAAAPEVAIHMAAQPLVREAYARPVETYAVNVMGTVNFLEAVRRCGSVKAVVNVTSDKCYENREWVWGYREDEPMGGYDPYSSSKACSELVTAAYRASFFPFDMYKTHGVAIATARAGNVIGGGDWAGHRIIPDCIRAVVSGERIVIRNPHSIRPWQHVLEPLSGYLGLARRLYEQGTDFAGGWNFGPDDCDAKPVEWLVSTFCRKWGQGASYRVEQDQRGHEAHYLKLDCSKAKARLGWQPRWSLGKALDTIVEWTKAYKGKEDLAEVCVRQIREYCGAGGAGAA